MVKYCAILTLTLTTLSSTGFAKSLYNPDQLASFQKTNVCNNCDLSGASLSGNHSNAILTYTNLTGAIGTGTFSQSNFTGSNLSSSNWENANLSYAQLSYISLIDVNFTHANLSNANFEGSNTNNVIFDGANLYGSNITADQLARARSYCGATLTDGTIKNC